MSMRPEDTSVEAWKAQQEARARIGPEGCFRVAIELSDAVRELQIEGLLARHPGWDRAAAVRYLVASHFGIGLRDRA